MNISMVESNGEEPPRSPRDAARHELERLRAELDAIDLTLLDTVRARLDVCNRIGRLKQRTDIPVMQPTRMNEVRGRARDFAAEHGLSPEFLDTLYTVLITETCRLEAEIVESDEPR